jgi:hypothetical protein
MRATSRIHKLRVESESGRLTLREAVSNNLWEDSKSINWRGRAIRWIHVKINVVASPAAQALTGLARAPVCRITGLLVVDRGLWHVGLAAFGPEAGTGMSSICRALRAGDFYNSCQLPNQAQLI